MNTKHTQEQPGSKEGGEQATQTRSESRRRFVHGVGVVVPTILTVGSRSSLAGTCLSPSASASINLLHSRQDRPHDGLCGGRTPGYWKNAASNHGNLLAKENKFSVAFSDPSGFPEKSLEEVMSLRSGDQYNLGAHLAAAWCNWRMGWVSNSVVDLPDLEAMWRGRNGGYTPVTGVTWYAEEIVSYLKTTMPL